MRIPCPHCGPRIHDEFTTTATPRCADRLRTAPDAEAAFYDYVYVRNNPFGLHRELWFHQGGCHEWLVVERDTRNHEVIGAMPARDVFAGGDSQ